MPLSTPSKTTYCVSGLPAFATQNASVRAASGASRSSMVVTVAPSGTTAPADRRPGAPPDQRGHRERDQRHREGDLVEVEVDHLLQAPGEHGREPDQPAGAPPGGPGSRRDHGKDRHGGE